MGIIYHSQDNQIEVINMKKNSIFSIVRNGLYEQYLKLITNIDVKAYPDFSVADLHRPCMTA